MLLIDSSKLFGSSVHLNLEMHEYFYIQYILNQVPYKIIKIAQ